MGYTTRKLNTLGDAVQAAIDANLAPTYNARDFQRGIFQMIEWGHGQQEETRLTLHVIDHLITKFVPLMLEEAGAGDLAFIVPSINLRAPECIQSAQDAARECAEARGYLRNRVDTGKITERSYDIANEALENASLAAALVPNLIGAPNGDSFYAIRKEVVECIAEAHTVAERLNPSFEPTRRRFYDVRRQLTDQLYSAAF